MRRVLPGGAKSKQTSTICGLLYFFGVNQYGVTKGIMGVKEDYAVRKGFHQYI